MEASAEGGEDEGIKFSSLYSKLPLILPTTMAKNMSVPLSFVCLLHLANEKVMVVDTLVTFRRTGRL